MSTIEQRLAAAELDIQMLKLALAGLGGANNEAKQAPSNGQAAPRAQHSPTVAAKEPEVASDDLMSREWADMEIKRLPTRWQGDDFTGFRMSQCPADFLIEYAKLHEWKAQKGREENPPRLNAKGKPWYESDELIAKIARGWAQRVRGPATPVQARRAPPAPESLIADEDIPF